MSMTIITHISCQTSNLYCKKPEGCMEHGWDRPDTSPSPSTLPKAYHPLVNKHTWLLWLHLYIRGILGWECYQANTAVYVWATEASIGSTEKCASNQFQQFGQAKKTVVIILKAVLFCEIVTAHVCTESASVATALQKATISSELHHF